ncbi:unnamed protein product [Arabidopsis halleri]
MNKKKRQKVPKNGDWSKLCPDVLRKIFETLRSPVDSHRAKIVCSDWYSVWKTCAKRPPCPLRIIHQGDSPTLGKGNRKLVGLFHHGSYCMASSGNWLLMVGLRLKFYIYNLMTKERIDLPSMESQILGGQVRFKPEREYFHGYLVGPSRRDKVPYDYEAVEWEKSLAVLMLYLLTIDHRIKIFYFSGDFFTGEQYGYWGSPFNFVAQPWEYVWKRKLAIRRSGEVLIVLSLKEKVKKEEKLLFYIFKMNLESCKWERVYSIGDEMLIFGRGVTVPLALKDLGDGIKSDSIYFVDEDVWPDHKDHDHRVSNCGVFDIATSKIEWPKKIYCFINKSHWFVRGVAY